MGMIVGRILRIIAWPIMRILFPYRVVGKENKPKRGENKGYIVCCNHISCLDPAYLLCSQPRPIRFMAKKEIFENRLAAFCVSKWFGAFPVDRGTGDTLAITHSEEIVKAGELLGIFPEGTRTKTGELGRFKSGASVVIARTGADVLPVALITKGQKVRPFRTVTVVYGKPLSAEELHLTGEKPDIRYATRALAACIDKMIEEQR